MAKIAEVQEVRINDLKPYAKNAKKHSDDQVEKICKSIKEFEFINPCLIDNEKNVIAGHGRIMAAKELGMKTVPCAYGWKEGAPHYFIDLRSLTTCIGHTNLEDLDKEEAIKMLRDIYDSADVLYADKPRKSENHPTMKPVNLFKTQIRNSTKPNDIVLDTFGGGGQVLLRVRKWEGNVG